MTRPAAPQQVLRTIYDGVRFPITREEAVDLAADTKLPLDDGAGVEVRDLVAAVPESALASNPVLIRALMAAWTRVAGSLRPFAGAGDEAQ